jgi:hypothetical protein
MSSALSAVRLGSQSPSFSTVAPGRVDSYGADVTALAAAAGLILDPWQQLCVDQFCAVRADGRWCAFEVGLVVARQNGKNAVLEAIELAALFLWDERLIAHSAHKFPTAQEHFLRMRQLIDQLAEVDPAARGVKITTANGKEALELRSGARLRFFARSKGGGRGFSGDRIVFDEAFDLTSQALGSMIPTMAARSMTGNPQLMFSSSAPHATSVELHRLLDRTGRTTVLEWGNPVGTDPHDREAWARANPGLGVRISEEFVENELATLSPAEFGRERLGIRDALVTDEITSSPFVGWDACHQAGPLGRVVGLAVDVPPEAGSVVFAVADETGRVQLASQLVGTHGAVDEAARLASMFGVPCLIDPRSQAGGLLAGLVRARVPVVEVSGPVWAQACAGFAQAVAAQRVTHSGQPPLDVAVAGAVAKPVGESWVVGRRSSTVDVSPLVATILAWSRTVAPSTEFFVY